MAPQKCVGEDDVHPGQQLWVARRIGLRVALGVEISPYHPVVEAADAGGFGLGHGGVGERHRDQPLDGARETPERILSIARVIVYTGHSPGVESLHEQGPDARHHGRHATVYGPCCRPRPEVADVLAVFDLGDPVRPALGVAGKSGEKPRSPGLPQLSHCLMVSREPWANAEDGRPNQRARASSHATGSTATVPPSLISRCR